MIRETWLTDPARVCNLLHIPSEYRSSPEQRGGKVMTLYTIEVLDPALEIAGVEYPAEWIKFDARATRPLAARRVLELVQLSDAEYRVVSPRGVVTLTSATCREVIANAR